MSTSHATLDREIRARIDAFVTDLSNLVKISALEAIRDALGAELGGSPARRGPGRPRKSGVPSPIAAGPLAPRRGRRGKRSSEDVRKTADAVLAYVRSNEGQRLEEIGRGLGIATKELKLPVAKLFEAGAIKTKGQKRGTRYFAR
jgi:hypothetical protein